MKRIIGTLIVGLLASQMASAKAKVLSEEYIQRSAWDLRNESNPQAPWVRISMTFEVDFTQEGRAEVINAVEEKVKTNCELLSKAAETKSDGTGPMYMGLPSSDDNRGVMEYSLLYMCK